MIDQPTHANVVDLDSLRMGFTLHRVQAALEGRFNASLLSDAETALLNDLFGASLDIPATAEALEFRASFAGQSNTDL